MNKKGLKNYFSGMLTMALMLTMVVSIDASAGTKTLEVFYNDLQLVVDGIKVELGMDTSGNPIEPFILNGTTYLPVRAVAESLGEEVGWNGETKTVFIGKRSINDEDATYIGNGINHFDSKQGYYANKFSYAYGEEIYTEDNIGNKYNNLFYIYLDNSYGSWEELFMERAWQTVEFPTNSLYSTFKANLSISADTMDSRTIGILAVYADDEIVAEYTVESGQLPEEIEVDIKNALNVKFRFYADGQKESGSRSISAVMFNPRFIE